jgi:hypothetical protein
MHEAMLACINITKLTFEISAATGHPKIPLICFCKTANSTLGKQGKLLKYQHLIANPKT